MRESHQDDFSFKNFFIPLTTFKAIHIIGILGFIVFGNMLLNGFVWDDRSYILLNPDSHTVDIPKLFGQNLFNAGGQYRPIPAIYFASLYTLFGTSPFFYHIFQLILHIVNTILVLLVFSKFFHKRISLFVALIFLVHPIQVESVSYIAATGNPLFFFFGMTALYLSLKNVLSWRRIALVMCLLLLSILTKETGILFLVMILLYRLLFKKGSHKLFYAGGLIVIMLYAFIRFEYAGVFFSKLMLTPIARLNVYERILNIPAVIFYYLKTLLFPVQLSIQQHWVVKDINFSNFYIPLVVDLVFFITLAWLGYYLFHKRKHLFSPYIFFLLWFLAGLLFHVQIFPLDMTVADRWFYFSFVGLLGVIAIGLESIKFSKKHTLLLLIIGISILALLSVRTIVRNTNWSDVMTLYLHDIQINDNFVIRNDLATEYGFLQQYNESIKHAEKSVEMFPNETNIYGLGYAYEKSGNNKKAIETYQKALNSEHYYPSVHKNNLVTYERLSFLLTKTGDLELARKTLRVAVKDYPEAGSLWGQLAYVEYKLQHQEGALTAAENARKYLPNPTTQYFYEQILNKRPLDIQLE